MLQKILIANRGAIATRIIRTLKKMGISSVAIYSEADRNSPHVRMADEAFCVGPAPAAQSYLQGEVILEIAKKCGAQGIHPGYGFLSENAEFARACEAAGIVWIGPHAQAMELFGPKHSARAIAAQAQVPMLPGTGLLQNVEEACAEAERIGYPVMLKATAGGGGIGMRVAHNAEELRSSYEAVISLGRNNFKDGGVFLERFVQKARHIEVQIFGNRQGEVVALGERDCSAQRRNQKVIEESPAPHLKEAIRMAMHQAAIQLAKTAGYRSAGTVEFLFDSLRQEFYFLEVNTRLQVEHGVTEEVHGIDLVEWMIRESTDELLQLPSLLKEPMGHSMQARIYAEDPYRNFAPSAGLLDQVHFPADLRVETWVEHQSEVSGFYDPMLAKMIAWGATREEARLKLAQGLAECQLHGIVTNVPWLSQILAEKAFIQGDIDTHWLATVHTVSHAMEVLDGGMQSTLQDWPGRIGLWDVGVPPCGPMDDFSFRQGNLLLGNAEGATGLELTLQGGTYRFRSTTRICLTGAPLQASLDQQEVPWGEPFTVPAGSTLKLGAVLDGGMRAYLLIAGGFHVPQYLGSTATFTLGNFGGHNGRALQVGDTIPYAPFQASAEPPKKPWPSFGHTWEIQASAGPHCTAEYIEEDWIEEFFGAEWEVHFQSARTGVRLIGPRPRWARKDGGDAGLHPSNLHDNAYAIGSVDFTGDMPVILGPDGPSLGGFVCPATVLRSELWKLGQLRPGDKLRFVRVAQEGSPILAQVSQDLPFPVVIRRAGDCNLLVEYGAMELDLRLRFRAHALMSALQAQKDLPILDLTPGIRSLQVHFEPALMSMEAMVQAILQCERNLPPLDQVRVPSRIVHLPLSWDDPSTRIAIERYQKNVRPDAPWCPSNIDFIRRINGLESVDDVQQILFDASYLVLGLGDVYLGAPVAVPLDPRHRLVTTKYNPARTWTPENAVGIGGAYLCVYGMEGPGGYQFVGRTIQMWNRSKGFVAGEKPWLLRFFDQIRFYPVDTATLHQHRADVPLGRFAVRMEETEFDLGQYEQWMQSIAAEDQAYRKRQKASFQAERDRWKAQGLAEYVADAPSAANDHESEIPKGQQTLRSPIPGSLWKILVQEGQAFQAGDTLMIAESMKMEMPIVAQDAGVVKSLRVQAGTQLRAGQILLTWE